MLSGILGKKAGMTTLFDEYGNAHNVTVIVAGPCTVVNKRTLEKDGYTAVQLGYEAERQKNITKPLEGYFKKLNIAPHKYLREFRVDKGALDSYQIGQEIKVDSIFGKGEFVDVTGRTKGRGFAGVMKRWNFAGFPMTRGTHFYRRHPGSIGNREWPGRVMKGKKMAGHYGDEQVTIQNLKIYKIDPKNNLIYIEGAVPGPAGEVIEITKSVKKAV
ncbi:MAG: 50S ribosomal protein L3, partial [Deltaproteobacteria bacterium]|nr:50S ribosomal protein L3 [Deltaproteobacteria bacterium]